MIMNDNFMNNTSMTNNTNNTNVTKKNKFLLVTTIVSILVIIVLVGIIIFNKNDEKIVYVTPSSELKVGDIYTLQAKYKKDDEKKELVYVTETPNIVEVDKETGEIVAKKEGKATIKIYVKDDPSIYEYVDINIKANANSEITPKEETTPKEEVKPKEETTPKEEQGQAQESTPTQIPTPTQEPKEETTTIKIKNIKLSIENFVQDSTKYYVGDTVQVKVEITPSNATEKVVWQTNNKTICTTDQNGKIKALKNGICTVYVSSESNPNLNKEISFTINPSVGIVEFEKNNTAAAQCPNALGSTCTVVYNCKSGDKFNILLRAYDSSKKASVKSFKSNDTNIATIERHPTLSANCINCMLTQITCKNAGTTTFEATNSLGGTATAKIVVK